MKSLNRFNKQIKYKIKERINLNQIKVGFNNNHSALIIKIVINKMYQIFLF